MQLSIPLKFKSMLLDDTVPIERRKEMLVHVCQEGGSVADEVLVSLLKDAKTPKSSRSVYEKRARELAELLQQMNEGPLRHGTFLRMLEPAGSAPRAQVVLEDGASAFVVVPDPELAEVSRCGDTVLLDAQGRAILRRDPMLPRTGEEGCLERRLDATRLEVTIGDHERRVVESSAVLLERVEAGEVGPGSRLLVCPRRNIAFDAIPGSDELTYLRFLCREPPPDVRLERDLGAPPTYLMELLDLVRIEMVRPELRRDYGLPRCVMKLLTGLSGTGKTYSILALWRELYELMSEITGTPVDELPYRVLRAPSSQVLSKWLGESDKNLDRFFDEAEALAAQPFDGPDGVRHALPVLVILEEIDGLARTRGEDAILDRILTTALRRLDSTRPALRDRLLLFVATTNVADQVDPAFLRRVGGTVERFGRLRRPDFMAILEKHLQRRPLAAEHGADAPTAAREILVDLTGWLFGDEASDPGQVEIHCAGATAPERRYRRDFLTASVIDRAVQAASSEACRAEAAGAHETGLTAAALKDAFDRQIRSIVEGLTPANARNHVDVPDGARIATVRRIPQPSVQPHHLERVA